MSAYAGLPTAIAVAASRLDDAISTQERVDGCGYTLILIPIDPTIPVLVSVGGKPIPPTSDITLSEALGAALSLRGEAAGR